MRALVFEPFSSAFDDMIIGSLLDLGVKESKIADALSIFGLELEVGEVEKEGIVAKKVGYIIEDKEYPERRMHSYKEIVREIKNSGLSREVMQNSLNIFERIANAEAKVHGEHKERLTFHDIGALDTIGDLVGSVIAFLNIHSDIIISTPISVGGEIRSR